MSTRRPPEDLLDAWYGSTAVAQAVAATGMSVSVILASLVPGRIERSGVIYDFVAPERESQRITRSRRFLDLLRATAPDVLHVHGLGFPREILDLTEEFPSLPVLLQDHASRTPRIWRWPLWRKAFGKGPESEVVVAAGERFQLRFGLLLHVTDAGGQFDHAAAYRDFMDVIKRLPRATETREG